MNECFICEIFNKIENNKDEINWYDMPLFIEDDFIAFPALGQLIEGYLLIAPKEHSLSSIKLNYQRAEALLNFSKKISGFQSIIWEKPTIFEHGACQTNQKSGACISHAHWHLIPGNWDNLLPIPSINLRYSSFLEFYETNKSDEAFVLQINSDNSCFITNKEDIPSQYIRRLLAKQIHKDDEWDYLVFPFFENIRKTINKFNIINKKLVIS
jgi:diadenosine tetraphosphate (Ap4A) HIT family hydrolase